MRDGLRLCLSLGINAIEVEVDASSVVSLLANAAETNSEFAPLVLQGPAEENTSSSN